MKKYLGWIFAMMASLSVVSAYADSDTASSDEVVIADDQGDEEMEPVE